MASGGKGTTEAFKESYPMAYSSTREGKSYFGALSCGTKMAVTFPVLSYSALRYFEVGYMKKFYTDDYPRASLLCRNRDLSGLDGPRPQGVSMCFPSSQPPDVHAWSDRQHLTPQEDAQENRLTSQTKRINHHNPVCYSKYIDLYRVKR
ncbi:unnamed protein product [Durusdinium trenchii]|uniref:Uncharacterized protein n=1 Tax=Durusdinium trenchii TaxID=1381693 RepID=A0ABP0HIG6_9DINO